MDLPVPLPAWIVCWVKGSTETVPTILLISVLLLVHLRAAQSLAASSPVTESATKSASAISVAISAATGAATRPDRPARPACPARPTSPAQAPLAPTRLREPEASAECEPASSFGSRPRRCPYLR